MADFRRCVILIGDGTREPGTLAGQGQDGQLDQLKPIDHEIEQANFVGVDDIFASGSGCNTENPRKTAIFGNFGL